MKKIISLFKRDYDSDRTVIDEVTPGAEWVQEGYGVATQKLDGTCCMVRDNKLYKRYTLRKKKFPPVGFEPVTEVDPKTGKQEGWVPVGIGPEDRWHREAFAVPFLGQKVIKHYDGTYELLGPKVQGNPENVGRHILMKHGTILLRPPREYGELIQWFVGRDIEGIVWHHVDGRMVKIKKKDFGMKRED